MAHDFFIYTSLLEVTPRGSRENLKCQGYIHSLLSLLWTEITWDDEVSILCINVFERQHECLVLLACLKFLYAIGLLICPVYTHLLASLNMLFYKRTGWAPIHLVIFLRLMELYLLQVMCPTCLCTGMAMASEHDPRIDPFDWILEQEAAVSDEGSA